MRQNSVRRQSTRPITAIKKTAVKNVSVKYMMPGPEHHANRVQIVGGARHDVAGPVFCVKILRKRDDVREQIVPQIELDVARQADQDDAHPILERFL